MSEQSELKACPFCNSTSVMLYGLSVECRTCGAMGPDDTRKGRNPSLDWNTRHPAPLPDEAIQKARGALKEVSRLVLVKNVEHGNYRVCVVCHEQPPIHASGCCVGEALALLERKGEM